MRGIFLIELLVLFRSRLVRMTLAFYVLTVTVASLQILFELAGRYSMSRRVILEHPGDALSLLVLCLCPVFVFLSSRFLSDGNLDWGGGWSFLKPHQVLLARSVAQGLMVLVVLLISIPTWIILIQSGMVATLGAVLICLSILVLSWLISFPLIWICSRWRDGITDTRGFPCLNGMGPGKHISCVFNRRVLSGIDLNILLGLLAIC